MNRQSVLPRWRGFNLPARDNLDLKEADFRTIADWGFDFVRIPLSYHLWTNLPDRRSIREQQLEKVDRLVEWGGRYGLHVDLNFHRAPGYTCSPWPEPDGGEPWSLWKSPEALEVLCHHWDTFTRRYRSVSSDRLSFNLLNETPPPSDALPEPSKRPFQDLSRADHERVIRTVVASIRRIDPDRLIIVDGMWYARGIPCAELVDLGVAQSTRAYMPMGLSHYKAPWWREGGLDFPEPRWPGAFESDYTAWNRKTLEHHYNQWAALSDRGVGVHCGEAGAFRFTPHRVFLAWFEDVLDVLKSLNIGFALWELRGEFGVLNSDRADVAYEDFQGQKLDRALLDLMRRY